ncbi:MAG TPA: four helix bundle protein [Pyrinomonadaceae bacterium]|nr:four helix bundle protein [Pyrinomonadaceae bacterium]
MNATAAKSFRDLPAWQKAHQFVLAVYNYSDYFPQKEVHGLTQQFRRAAIAVPSSIIKSLREEDGAETNRLLGVARTSLDECRYYLVLAKDLGYGDHPELLPQLEEVGQLLEKYRAAILTPDS